MTYTKAVIVPKTLVCSIFTFLGMCRIIGIEKIWQYFTIELVSI